MSTLALDCKELTEKEYLDLKALQDKLPCGNVKKICEREGCSRISAILRSAKSVVEKAGEGADCVVEALGEVSW